MIHTASTLFWTDVPRGNQCTCVAEMRHMYLCMYVCMYLFIYLLISPYQEHSTLSCSCELAVTVKLTPKKRTWLSVVAITSQRTSKCLVEQSRTRHLNVHDMTRNSWQWLDGLVCRQQHDSFNVINSYFAVTVIVFFLNGSCNQLCSALHNTFGGLPLAARTFATDSVVPRVRKTRSRRIFV